MRIISGSFKGKKILAVIPARAGSKRIKNKSLLKSIVVAGIVIVKRLMLVC